MTGTSTCSRTVQHSMSDRISFDPNFPADGRSLRELLETALAKPISGPIGSEWQSLIDQIVDRVSEVTAFFADRLKVQQKRSEEHTSELQSLMRISYAVFCLKK